MLHTFSHLFCHNCHTLLCLKFSYVKKELRIDAGLILRRAVPSQYLALTFDIESRILKNVKKKKKLEKKWCEYSTGFQSSVLLEVLMVPVFRCREEEAVATRVQYIWSFGYMRNRPVGASINMRFKGVTFTTSWYWRHWHPC